MSWGSCFFYYHCPACDKNFKSATDTITYPSFGQCPLCHTEGTLIGESGAVLPPDTNDYEDTLE